MLLWLTEARQVARVVLSVVDRLPAATEASWNSSDGPRVVVSANDPLPERSLHGAGHRRQKAFVRALRPGRRQHLGASSGWLPLTRARLVAVTTTSSSCFSTSAMEYYKLPHYGRLLVRGPGGQKLTKEARCAAFGSHCAEIDAPCLQTKIIERLAASKRG